MIPPACDYHRAGSVDEALDLLQAHADRDAALLAGGHGLVPDMKIGRASPNVLVDIRTVPELESVAVEADGETLAVGALTTHATLASAETIGSSVPVLASAASHVADRQIRNRGTIGGNLAEADPGADLPPATLAADAEIRVRGSDGERSIDASEFFRGDGQTSLPPEAILTTVRFPIGEYGDAYVRKTHPASGYAMVGVAARTATADGAVTEARVAVGGLTDRPMRLGPVEEALVGSSADEAAIDAAADRASDALDADDLRGDSLASGTYRREILGTYVERALGTAVERARGAQRD